MSKPRLLVLASLLALSRAVVGEQAFLGSWLVEVVPDSDNQYPFWREIKYPKQLTIFREGDDYQFFLIDQFGDQCSGTPMLVNRGMEIVFEWCGGGGTKHAESWGPIHHAKVVQGQLHGVVSSNGCLFRWRGERQQ